jgi:hypothetical protein
MMGSLRRDMATGLDTALGKSWTPTAGPRPLFSCSSHAAEWCRSALAAGAAPSTGDTVILYAFAAAFAHPATAAGTQLLLEDPAGATVPTAP